MPYVNIQVTDEEVTKEQKQEIIARVTEIMSIILKKDPNLTHVVIQEIGLDNWGWKGKQVSEIRKEQ
ncbi:tautomerase family protein [Flavobacterium sedimenticola]|uniref:Tautomerase n=1 Tax=Flavobacterium sedimenticola TaxID=3043286 RepID=A0ABT6XT01_9FLAO|nr:4-oxalocrotonate tautomerase family protein [Flavobacterium sedimenticola]MDI9257927.1 4-oxalocrotonate tautomerase family protein [Flavobacterium sedimenticola]